MGNRSTEGIEVVGGPCHNRIDGNLVNGAVAEWDAFVAELERGTREHGVNNNELKEKIGRVKAAIDALYLSVMLLPAQGRVVSFTATSTTTMSEILAAASRAAP